MGSGHAGAAYSSSVNFIASPSYGARAALSGTPIVRGMNQTQAWASAPSSSRDLFSRYRLVTTGLRRCAPARWGVVGCSRSRSRPSASASVPEVSRSPSQGTARDPLQRRRSARSRPASLSSGAFGSNSSTPQRAQHIDITQLTGNQAGVAQSRYGGPNRSFLSDRRSIHHPSAVRRVAALYGASIRRLGCSGLRQLRSSVARSILLRLEASNILAQRLVSDTAPQVRSAAVPRTRVSSQTVPSIALRRSQLNIADGSCVLRSHRRSRARRKPRQSIRDR